jgi:hypothetical protein
VAVSTIHSFIKVRAKHRKQVQYELGTCKRNHWWVLVLSPTNLRYPSPR